MKGFILFGIDSGTVCPDTGTWYANYHDEKDVVSYDSVQTFKQGDEFPALNGKPTKWSFFDVAASEPLKYL